MIRRVGLILVAASLLLVLCATAQAHTDTAAVYWGTYEVGSNTGPGVDKFLANVGLDPGYAWCAAFVSYCLDAPINPPVNPDVRSPVAQNFIVDDSIPSRDVLRGVYKPVRGDLVVWKRGNGPYGHVGQVLVWVDERCGYTLEGNTTSMYHEGPEGVWVKRRCITPGAYFNLSHFTKVEYATR